jgi:hypothetical protein
MFRQIAPNGVVNKVAVTVATDSASDTAASQVASTTGDVNTSLSSPAGGCPFQHGPNTVTHLEAPSVPAQPDGEQITSAQQDLPAHKDSTANLSATAAIPSTTTQIEQKPDASTISHNALNVNSGSTNTVGVTSLPTSKSDNSADEVVAPSNTIASESSQPSMDNYSATGSMDATSDTLAEAQDYTVVHHSDANEMLPNESEQTLKLAPGEAAAAREDSAETKETHQEMREVTDAEAEKLMNQE